MTKAAEFKNISQIKFPENHKFFRGKLVYRLFILRSTK